MPFRRELPSSKDEHRINDRIRVPRVKVVDENGVMLGEMGADQARQIARERGFDLVEVAADARPPVCKLLDYGKFKYEQKKQQKKSKKKQHVQVVKEVRLRPLTDDHDVATKVKKAREILEEGDKILITVFFRGREQAHKEIGRELMSRIKKDLEDVSKIEHDISMQGPRMQITLLPKPGMKPKTKAGGEEPEADVKPEGPAPETPPAAPPLAVPPPPATATVEPPAPQGGTNA
ncbi:MAG TPA: translation initiation factor IF-3 [Planctomycetota bacterium]|nr:translation initiation factor IF-3 [Planctomycetota bacterium]